MNASNTCAQGSHSVAVTYEVSQRLEQCGEAKSGPWSAFVTVLGAGGSRVTRVGLPGQVYCTLPALTEPVAHVRIRSRRSKNRKRPTDSVAMSKTVLHSCLKYSWLPPFLQGSSAVTVLPNSYCAALHRQEHTTLVQVSRQPYQMRQAFARAGLETVCRSRFGRLEGVTRNSRSVS